MLRCGSPTWSSGTTSAELNTTKGWEGAAAAVRRRLSRTLWCKLRLSRILAVLGAVLACAGGAMALTIWTPMQRLARDIRGYTDASTARTWKLGANTTSGIIRARHHRVAANTPATLSPATAGANMGASDLGCSFRRCVTRRVKVVHARSSEGTDGVLASFPFTYVTIPFRNRLDNLARLLSSINNATTPAQRACVCVLVVDFGTTLATLPPWKNPRCLVTMHAVYNMYVHSMETLPRHVTVHDAVSNLRPDDCPTALYTGASGAASIGEATYPAHNRSMVPNAHIQSPMHVNVAGRTGAEALHDIVSLYAGESLVISGNTVTNATFSRAGAIQAGLNAIHTPANKSLVFVCDVDMIVRPGFFQKMWKHTLPAKQVYLPICWAMCYGAGMDSLPTSDTFQLAEHAIFRAGFWHHFGAGMVAAYASDLRAVNALEELKDKADWGNEDWVLMGKLRNKFAIHRKNTSELVHMYHPRMPWTTSRDGVSTGKIELAGLARYLCTDVGFCRCPVGTSAKALADTVEKLLRWCDAAAGLGPSDIAACRVLTNWTRAEAKAGSPKDF